MATMEEVQRYADCDRDLIGAETRDYTLGVLEALAGMRLMLGALGPGTDTQDSTSRGYSTDEALR